MIISEQQEVIVEPVHFPREGLAALREMSDTCILTRTDRRAIAEQIQIADRIGTGAYVMLVRLLSQKLLYASVVEDNRASEKLRNQPNIS